jgi:HEAT repeat protein
MKSILWFIVTSVAFSAAAQDRSEYYTQRAFEAGQESEAKQVNAIRECAVSKIHACVYPLIEHLKKDGKEFTSLRRESVNALGRLEAPEAREPLIALLAREQDLFIKAAIIRALGKIGNKADIKTVSPYLSDKEILLRRQSARALYELNDKAASAEVAAKIAAEKDDYTRAEMLNTALQYEGGKIEHALNLSKILLSSDRAARLRTAEIMASHRCKETLVDLRRASQVETDLEVRRALDYAIAVTSFFPELPPAPKTMNH